VQHRQETAEVRGVSIHRARYGRLPSPGGAGKLVRIRHIPAFVLQTRRSP
jgi:hypothetical protein